MPGENLRRRRLPRRNRSGQRRTHRLRGAPPTSPISAPVYNLQQPPGLPLDFGIHASVPLVANEHIFLEGHVSWNTDFHEYFEINNISQVDPAAEVQADLQRTRGRGQLPHAAERLLDRPRPPTWKSNRGKVKSRGPRPTPRWGSKGAIEVPFKPTAEAHPETAKSDEPDGVTAEVKAPQNVGAEAIDTADIDDAHVTLPEGLTLNPSARARAGRLHRSAGGAPADRSRRAHHRARHLPRGLQGREREHRNRPAARLARRQRLPRQPHRRADHRPPYTIYVDAESALGVSVRLQGQVTPNPGTGRLEATFAGNPQLPFSDLAMKFDGGPLAPLANPLSCADRGGRSALHALHRRRSRAQLDTVRRHRLPLAAAVLAQPEHPRHLTHRRRLHLLHLRPRPRERAAVPRRGQNHAARRPARRDSFGAAVRGSAGQRRDVPRGQRNRQRLGERRRRPRTVRVRRQGVSDGALQRCPLRPLDRGAARAPVPSISAT